MEQMRLYAVVEFPQSGNLSEVAVVPHTWIQEGPNGTECFWPVKEDGKKTMNMIKKHLPPDQQWEKYSCSIASIKGR